MRISDWSSDVCSSDLEREDALDAFAERQLAHGEVRAHALVRARDAHALEILDAGALAFDDAHADAQRVAGTESRNLFAGLGDFFGFDRLAEVHGLLSFFCFPAAEAGRSRETGRAPVLHPVTTEALL